MAGKYCGHWNPSTCSVPIPPPSSRAKRRHIRDTKLKRHYIAGLCPGPSAQDDARYAAMVLSDVLGDHEGSRLFWALVEPGLADEADFSFFPHDHTGSFLVYASCDPDRAAQVEGILLGEAQSRSSRMAWRPTKSSSKKRSSRHWSCKGNPPWPMRGLASAGSTTASTARWKRT